MLRSTYLALALVGFLAIGATGCIVNMEPRSAVNPVGTDHTVTVTLQAPDITEDEFEEILCLLLEELFPNEQGPCLLFDTAVPAESIQHDFEVIEGPNKGTHSSGDDIEVEEGEDEAKISWTYTSNGVPGRDLIRFCLISNLQGIDQSIEILYTLYRDESQENDLTEQEFVQFIVEFFNEKLNLDFDSFEDLFCETVTKTWIDQRPPNIGGGLSGLFQGQPTPLPTAAAPAPAATSPVIRPPSTGDAGLR